MTDGPRKIGTAWETAVVNHLHQRGILTAERRALHGNRDIGDLTGLPGFLIGCKNERAIRLALYMDELRVQRGNLVGGNGVVTAEVVKRRGSGPGRAYVVTELDDWIDGVLFPLLESPW
jgi:hypothetical protein